MPFRVFTDASKEGWSAHLGDFTANGTWSLPESQLHINFLELKAVFLALKTFQHLVENEVVLIATGNTTVCGIHQQGGRYEVRLTLCPSLAPPVLVQSETYCPKGQTHSRPSECDCGKAVATRSDNTEGMLPSSRGVRPPVPNMAQPAGRYVRDQIQLQTDQVRVPSPGPERLGSGCSNSLLGGSGHVCLSPSVPSGQSDQQTVGSSLQKSNSDSPRLAQHAIVLGPSGSFISDTHLSPKPPRSGDSTI